MASLGGYLYYVIFIDDFSRKTWIHFLKSKDQTFKKFKDYKALVENQTGKSIKILRTNSGTEYESNEFKEFCREAGIKRETIVPYNPEQNGIAERKNRTIMKAAKAMIHDQDLAFFLWAESGNTIVYVQNRCPRHVLNNLTLEEVFTSMKPEVGHFRYLEHLFISMCQGKREISLRL